MYIQTVPQAYGNVDSFKESDSTERRIFVSRLKSEALAELCFAAICTGGQYVHAFVCVCVCVCVYV